MRFPWQKPKPRPHQWERQPSFRVGGTILVSRASYRCCVCGTVKSEELRVWVAGHEGKDVLELLDAEGCKPALEAVPSARAGNEVVAMGGVS